MSDKPIAAGDLVRVVKWPCCGAGLGLYGVVEKIESPGSNQQCVCNGCCRLHPPMTCALCDGGYFPLEWLKRVPPISEPETVTAEEEIAA